jgi:hypothetical protein
VTVGSVQKASTSTIPKEPLCRRLAITMDSHGVEKLRKHCERGELPTWRGVMHLTPEASAAHLWVDLDIAVLLKLD